MPVPFAALLVKEGKEMHLNPFDEEKILLRFGVLSDCHLGMEPSEDDKKLQKLLRTFLHMAGSATSSGCTAR